MNTHNNTLTTTPMIRYSGTVKSETEYGTVFMKNSRVLLILFASILLLIPTASPRAAAVSITLTPGTTSLIGTVDVSTLPQTDQSSVNMNQAPLHSQGLQAFDQAKAQAAQTPPVAIEEPPPSAIKATCVNFGFGVKAWPQQIGRAHV